VDDGREIIPPFCDPLVPPYGLGAVDMHARMQMGCVVYIVSKNKIDTRKNGCIGEVGAGLDTHATGLSSHTHTRFFSFFPIAVADLSSRRNTRALATTLMRIVRSANLAIPPYGAARLRDGLPSSRMEDDLSEQ
jgi:hypothetical protein